uniref:Uncharacterized protein n=1 Tax=viral metagenome TaxID=1070528 RepID=A0A6C0BF10_9ZZZZ
MEEYESYSWIQHHINLSECLYDIDRYGKHILEEIRSKKNQKTNKRGLLLSQEYTNVYDSIFDTINVQRFKSRLYLTLQYYLDEALFNPLNENEEFFYIDDECYELTKLYFDQEHWIRNTEIQKFSLTFQTELTTEDAMLLRCFFTKYSEVTNQVEKLLELITGNHRFKPKIKSVIGKIRQKHAPSIKILEDFIANDVNK